MIAVCSSESELQLEFLCTVEGAAGSNLSVFSGLHNVSDVMKSALLGDVGLTRLPSTCNLQARRISHLYFAGV